MILKEELKLTKKKIVCDFCKKKSILLEENWGEFAFGFYKIKNQDVCFDCKDEVELKIRKKCFHKKVHMVNSFILKKLTLECFDCNLVLFSISTNLIFNNNYKKIIKIFKKLEEFEI